MFSGLNLSEEEVANKLGDIIKKWLPDKLKLVVLKGLEKGSAEFRVKQLPSQGPSWSKLAEIDWKVGKKEKMKNKSTL